MSGRDIALERLRPYIERARGFSGWDLGFIRKRPLDPPPPWDYETRARELAATARRVMDIGTGGGEVYSRIAAGLPGRFYACEEWVVNAHVAPTRLRPMGIDVVHCQTGERRLPFRDGAFDVVLARHEAIDPVEVDRILAAGGTCLTQQVIPDVWPELREFFPRATVFPDHWHEYPDGFRQLGYTVKAQRYDDRAAFETLGDLVALLLIAPWHVPEFDPEADIDALLALEAALTTPDGIVLNEGRYIVEATKGRDRPWPLAKEFSGPSGRGTIALRPHALEGTMLGTYDLVAFAATTDGARARTFYEGMLGLTCVSDDGFAVVFDAHGTQLRVTKVQAFTPQPFTILGWSVPDIEVAVDDLTSRGAVFQRYPGMDQDARGVWTAPGGARIAWFLDPDGNVLSLQGR